VAVAPLNARSALESVPRGLPACEDSKGLGSVGCALGVRHLLPCGAVGCPHHLQPHSGQMAEEVPLSCTGRPDPSNSDDADAFSVYAA